MIRLGIENLFGTQSLAVVLYTPADVKPNLIEEYTDYNRRFVSPMSHENGSDDTDLLLPSAQSTIRFNSVLSVPPIQSRRSRQG